MPDLRFTTALLLVLFTLTGCGKEAEERTSAELGLGDIRWGSFPVQVQVDAFLLADSNATADLNDAIAFWETKAGKPLFVIAGSWDSANKPFTGPAENPNELLGNVIFFQGPWPFDRNIAGKTIVHSSNGTIENSIIFLNAETNLCSHNCTYASGNVSRRKLLAHELGHFLGLGHNGEQTDIMYPEILQGGSLTGLSVDEARLSQLTN